MTAWAFDRHGHHRLRPIFSSDVGHFDVVDMTEVLEEAYEMVEHGLITDDDLREFVFANPARLHTAVNPDFFAGTVVESAVKKELAGGPHAAVVTTPAAVAFDQAIRSLRPSGTCSFIGVPGRDGDRLPISIARVIGQELSLRGSNVGSRLDLAEAIRFAVEGQVKVKVERQPLRAINKVFERMRRGKIVGRVVLDIAAGG